MPEGPGLQCRALASRLSGGRVADRETGYGSLGGGAACERRRRGLNTGTLGHLAIQSGSFERAFALAKV